MSDVDGPQSSAGVAWLPLSIAVSIAVVVSVYPQAAAIDGRADHPALMALFWSMTAGFVRGVGFVPRHPLVRWLCSSAACLLGLSLFGLRLATAG